MPDDLRKLLTLQWHDAASGNANRLNRAGVTFLDSDDLPELIKAECKGRDDLEGIARLAYAQAMADMVRYSGWVADDAGGNALGYWFGPDQAPIEAAPIVRFDTNGTFSILRGNGIVEAVLVVASHGNDAIFSELRGYLDEQGLSIGPRTIEEVRQPECAYKPQASYEQLIRSYRTDLSTTSAPDTGGPVNIMTSHRGPEID